MDAAEEPTPNEPLDASPRRPGLKWLACTCIGLSLLCLCTLPLAIPASQWRVRSHLLLTPDTQLVLGGEADDATLRKAAGVIRRRLRDQGILAVVAVESGTITVDLRRADAGRATELATREARIALAIVVDEDELGPEPYAAEVAHAREQVAAGTASPEQRYTAYPTHPGMFGAPASGWLLVRPDGLERGDFADFHRALDGRGLPAIGFEMTKSGGRRLYELTSENVDRRLAIIVNGEVRSAPTIRGAIGRRGIIEGGQKGWSEAELNALIALLDAGELPCSLELREERALGR